MKKLKNFRRFSHMVLALLILVYPCESRAEFSYNLFHRATVGTPEDLQRAVDAGYDVNARNDEGWTPLMLAAASNENVEVTKLLLKYGADIQAETDRRFTPLDLAVMFNENPDVVRVLLDHGADVAKDSFRAPLFALERYPKTELFETFMEYGFDLNARSGGGNTILIMAARTTNEPKIIELLLDNGAEIDAKGTLDMTALTYSAWFNENAGITQILLDAGADVHARSFDGGTVLIFAAGFSSNLDVIRLLLDAGAIKG